MTDRINDIIQAQRARDEENRRANPIARNLPEKAIYTRLRSGDWGVRITGGQPFRTGDEYKVVVTKRSGETKAEWIVVIWTGTDKQTGGPVALAKLARDDGYGETGTKPTGYSRYCGVCGETDCPGARDSSYRCDASQ